MVDEKERGKREESQEALPGGEMETAQELPTSSCWSQSPQQHLDHFPAWSHLIFTPCRQRGACPLIILTQAENVVELGLLFLILTPHEVCSQLLMAIPWHNSFLSPLIVNTQPWIYPALLKPALGWFSYCEGSLHMAGRKAWKSIFRDICRLQDSTALPCNVVDMAINHSSQGGGCMCTNGRAGTGFYIRQTEQELATSCICPVVPRLLCLQHRIIEPSRLEKTFKITNSNINLT